MVYASNADKKKKKKKQVCRLPNNPHANTVFLIVPTFISLFDRLVIFFKKLSSCKTICQHHTHISTVELKRGKILEEGRILGLLFTRYSRKVKVFQLLPLLVRSFMHRACRTLYGAFLSVFHTGALRIPSWDHRSLIYSYICNYDISSI